MMMMMMMMEGRMMCKLLGWVHVVDGYAWMHGFCLVHRCVCVRGEVGLDRQTFDCVLEHR